MNRKGPVIIIEDDLDDQEILEGAFKKFGHENELIFFGDAQLAFDYLKGTDILPF